MTRKKNSQVIYMLAVLFFLILTLGPIIWTGIISITPDYEMFKRNTPIFPKDPTLKNWIEIFSMKTSDSLVVLRGIKNSLFAVARTLLIGIPIVTITAYILTRIEFKGRVFMKNFLLITMVIPRLTIVIPVFRILASLRLLNNPIWLSVVYVSSFLPLTTWLLSNYFATIPRELEEASKIDGCSAVQTFLKIFLPLSYPILFSAALIIFLNTWNQFQIPLILSSAVDVKPISVVVAEFTTKEIIKYGLTATCGLLAVIPPAIMAMVFRKALIGGMVKGSVK